MPPEFSPLGRALILFGAILVGMGVVLLMAPELPWLGRLPGDLLIRRDGMTFYVPLTSSLLASLLLSLFVWIIGCFRR